MSISPNQADIAGQCTAQLKIANELAMAGDMESAIAHFRAALALNPRNNLVHDDLVYLLHFHPGHSDEEIFRELAIWEERHARPLANSILPHQNNRDPSRRLKIGYVSPEFCRQAESFFVMPLLESHDHKQFEVHCYSSVEKPDDQTGQMKKCADVWHEVSRLSDAALAEQIRRDQIDILIDLTMHMRLSRMLTFARKPAPVQVTWLAYPGGTGLRTMDYRLTDRYLDPPGLTCWYTEESCRLPDCWVCYSPLSQSALATPRTSGTICFGSLNHPRKINDSNMRLWAKIMRRVDGSRMVLHLVADQHRQRAAKIFQEKGIAPERLEFLGLQPRWQYLRTYDRIDIALDTLPYNGITTTCDALWMGTPVVSLVGKTTAGRAGLGILSTVGLPEWAANDPDQFIEIAVRLANDRNQLIDWRKNLRHRLETSPLMDAGRFAHNVESEYRRMWQRWCNKSSGSSMEPIPPAAIEHHTAGRLAEAEKIYRQILTRQPDHAGALHLLGVLCVQMNQFDRAVELIRQAIRLLPDSAEMYYNLGNALQNMGKLDAAIAAYRQAIRLKPDLTHAHNNIANVLKSMGRLDEAISAYRQAIALNPNLPKAHNNLGDALKDNRQLDEAIAAYRQAIVLTPNDAESHNDLGIALKYKGQFNEAIAAYSQAIALDPNCAEAYYNLGIALKDSGQLDEAVAAFRQAIRLKPDLAKAHSNLGVALMEKGQLDEAIVTFRQTIELRPDYAEAHSNLVNTLQYHPGYDAKMIHEELRRWNRQHAEPLAKFIRPHTNSRDPDRRLRIGYISPDFRDHVVGQNLLPLLREHDRTQMEIFCYAHMVQADAFTEQIRRYADVWRDIVGLSDYQAVDLIRRDQVDILVDLSLHTAHNRLLIFAHKPAPVQVTYLGYCSSTGLETIDYRLSDPHMDPANSDESVYSEQTIRLPETFWCYNPADPALEPLPPPATTIGYITFGCLNNFAKVSSALNLWAEILQVVPQSRLIVHSHPGAHLDAVRERFAAKGISPDRLEFPGRQSRPEYLRTYGRIDIALDPFPWGGGITTCDALWMGVPVVTLIGQTAVGRGGASILTNIGLPELIARTPEQYVRIAAGLAKDLPRLTELRRTLRSRMRTSPLMYAPRFTRNVEAAYRQMWRNWCAAGVNSAT